MPSIPVAAPCAHHPDTVVTWACDRCGRPLCASCQARGVVADVVVCAVGCFGPPADSPVSDEFLLAGLVHPLGIGASLWRRSASAMVERAALPVALVAGCLQLWVVTRAPSSVFGPTPVEPALWPVWARRSRCPGDRGRAVREPPGSASGEPVRMDALSADAVDCRHGRGSVSSSGSGGWCWKARARRGYSPWRGSVALASLAAAIRYGGTARLGRRVHACSTGSVRCRAWRESWQLTATLPPTWVGFLAAVAAVLGGGGYALGLAHGTMVDVAGTSVAGAAASTFVTVFGGICLYSIGHAPDDQLLLRAPRGVPQDVVSGRGADLAGRRGGLGGRSDGRLPPLPQPIQSPMTITPMPSSSRARAVAAS